MLSDHERRRLTSIERQLSSDDPGLARRLAAGPSSMRSRWAYAAAMAVLSICGTDVLIAILSLNATLLVGCGLPVVVAWTWLYRRRRRAQRGQRAEPGDEPDEPSQRA
jgi:Flp pilus assembly protein TadB